MSHMMSVGQWGVFCDPVKHKVAQLGDQVFELTSARKACGRTSRRILLDSGLLRDVLRTGKHTQRTVTDPDGEFIVEMHPIISPRSQCTMGLIAGVFHSGEPIPTPPLVGSWEWHIKRNPDGSPSSNRRTYWDENLHKIYDLNLQRHSDGSEGFDVNFWSSNMVNEADQARLSTMIRQGIHDGLRGVVDVYRSLTYNIWTGFGTSRQCSKHLRLIGAVKPVSPDDNEIVLRGFSMEVSPEHHKLELYENDPTGRIDGMLAGVMSISSQPLAIVDAASLNIMMTSPSWRAYGFSYSEGLHQVIGEDFETLHTFMGTVTRNQQRTLSRPVKIHTCFGGTRTVMMTVMGIRPVAVDDSPARDVVVRLDP